MRYLPVVLAVGMLVVAVGGCGSGGARTAGAGAQVETGSCQSSGADGHVTSQSCSFVLSGGQEFRCHKMVRANVPLVRIGQVLRHRSLQSTAIYARVDVERLRLLAAPWPGGAQR